MLYEDLRSLHEDVERLEQAIADRMREEPKHPRNRLERDHEIANFLSRIQAQSERALQIYNEEQEARTAEVQSISTGDPFESFFKQLDQIKEFHKKYPNEGVENLERTYRRTDEGRTGFAGDVDGMFTGEEAFGRFFDLIILHDDFLNLPGLKGAKKLTYLQYLDIFDTFQPPLCPIKREDKMTEQYFSYITSLAQYLESFMRRIRPLEDLSKLFEAFDDEFQKAWDNQELPGWEVESSKNKKNASHAPVTEGTGEGVWCADCAKEFKNDNVYRAHLTGKKHIKNAEARKERPNANQDVEMADAIATSTLTQRLKEKAIAEREFRVRKLTSAMKTEREDTRVNVERKAGMTDRERQQELAAMYAEEAAAATDGRGQENGGDADSDDDEKVYNPLKLPLAWDGKPIPFWLYKLHGLGVEFPCEICGNYVYMGRRAFDKHFSEARHIYGLKCLGITQTGMFREITQIEEAQKLWEKVQRDKGKTAEKGVGIVEMEDTQGNVMPQKVYDDLKRQGLL
ncbi:putative splicing factor 3a subunit 3 [Neohortaea acidophila]|uniref:Putative splicing factor 3a subunit 3 n=1 Tax=Neohortaea acidophila TaxID=245834 RepID=A0A6A6PT30_9PEZI|nr:putative splicing factor 3a subunit 3 [Neohortaea acidophila]KAF2483259.1 putative splicing factor 3a subunit 3 [Neohortaea acidophila]